jgi:5'/3'-nucleotidase
MTRPRILLTNDDGVRAPGLRAAFDALSEIADVTVVAPTNQRSGASHSLTLETPLRAHALADLPGYMVDFTPVDCVKLGLKNLLDAPPDLVVSGINRGSNAGYLVHYSGTVAAAAEAVILGYPALAVSVCAFKNPDYSGAAEVTRDVAARVLEAPLPPRVILNINVPSGPYAELSGYRWCRQSLTDLEDDYDEREDPRRTSYYWLTGAIDGFKGAENDDFRAVSERYVSLTPLTVDWTHEQLMRDGGGLVDQLNGDRAS